MSPRILHTADWQLGKPFASVPDPDKRLLLQRERFDVIGRLAARVAEHRVDLVLVAGDLFDSPTPTNSVVSAAFQAIGEMRVPVIAIPGNHDFGGPGGPWGQAFLRREMAELAPNFTLLGDPQPLVLDPAVILPAPLGRRQVAGDPTAWIRHLDGELPTDRPRIVLAHGSVQGFSSAGDEEAQAASNQLDLAKLPLAEIDYVALGDWHGTKQVGDKAWYAGTPEIDRFPKGADNRPGHALLVTVERGAPPAVETLSTGRIRWERLGHAFDELATLDKLEERFAETDGSGAAGALLELELQGHLNLAQALELQQKIESWEARLIRLKLRDHVRETPSEDEVQQLTERAGDPLIARVARRLLDDSGGDDDEAAATACLALRALYQAARS
jgi:DNA repair exonuclease SbcCD nuclease subunit